MFFEGRQFRNWHPNDENLEKDVPDHFHKIAFEQLSKPPHPVFNHVPFFPGIGNVPVHRHISVTGEENWSGDPEHESGHCNGHNCPGVTKMIRHGLALVNYLRATENN